MTTWPLVRGQVVQANIGLEEPKLLVVVSNNGRNRALPSVLCVRLTTTAKYDLASVVEMPEGEVFSGRAVCDDIIELYQDEVMAIRGGLTPGAISAINDGLRAALSLLPPPSDNTEPPTDRQVTVVGGSGVRVRSGR